MNILYIHGFGSQFDPDHQKVIALGTIGKVFGVDVDYTRPPTVVYDTVKAKIIDNHIDVIIGTSMGGYTAAWLGKELGIPFVSINPAIDPATSLRQYIGNNVDWTGNDFTLTETVVAEYNPIVQDGYGLVLLDRQDEVISAAATAQLLAHCFKVVEFTGGCHRFSHITDSLDDIKAFVENAAAMV